MQNVYQWLTNNDERIKDIVEEVIKILFERKRPLVLTERREHAEIINQLLIENKIQTVILRGGMSAKVEKQPMRI